MSQIYLQTLDPGADCLSIGLHIQSSRLALDNGQPSRNGRAPAIAQTVIIVIYVAQIPLDAGPRRYNFMQIHAIAGAAPLCRKIDDSQRTRINKLQEGLERFLAQGGHLFLDLLVAQLLLMVVLLLHSVWSAVKKEQYWTR